MRIAIKGPELTDVHFEEISDSRTDKFNCNLVTVCSSAINILILLGGRGDPRVPRSVSNPDNILYQFARC